MVVPELTNEGLARLFSSVYRQYLTVDEGGQFGSKEHHRIGDIEWSPQALHCDPFDQRLLAFLSAARPLPLRCRVGADETRSHAVDGNPERPQLVRQLSRQPDHRVFGRAICLDAGQRRAETGTRADVDNTTAAGTLHPRRYCLAQREGGTDIDRENAVPIGVPHFLDRMHLLPRDAAGVVDANELLMPVALHAAADDAALEHVESREQRGRAEALVIVGQSGRRK
jgi:hypothetical protein